MSVAERSYTADEFWEIASLPENEDRRLELEDGEIVDMGWSSPLNTIVAVRMATFINVFVLANDLGYVTGADGGFILPNGNTRRPDVGFVSKQRLSALPERFYLAPDLAVEVVSPNEDILKKVYEYLDSGTRLVWAIYAEDKTVIVFKFDEHNILRGERLDITGTLDGGDVLPGFTLAVKDIFPT
ncbi:MAG TPA: Uma2 family endonuclease [Oceanobacillus sp.]|nr:Uma2 family endonuclease [Oceanobacillus sp.]